MGKLGESVVFFGSGPVAARSLREIAPHFTIEAVITKPQPPHHKEPFPVLELAAELGLKTFTPNSKAELSELFATKPVKSRLGIVIDYGFIINQDVIDYFPLGIVNSHFSLLPEWRGADPITFTVLSGQEKTGVSLMLISAGLDEGQLIAQGTIDIDPGTTTPDLTDELIGLSRDMLLRALPEYVDGKIQPYDQKGEPTYSRKLTKDDGIIEWTKPAEQIEREIRAFIEWPKSRTTLAGKDVVITGSQVINEGGVPGNVGVQDKHLFVYCGEDALLIEKLKPAGKNEMTAAAFLAGYGHLL
jgi:methionyl-tRNA formyltransferase